MESCLFSILFIIGSVLAVSAENFTSEESIINEPEYNVVCYFSSSAENQTGNAKFLPEYVDTDLCSHVIYEIGVVKSVDWSKNLMTSLLIGHIDDKIYQRVTDLKEDGVRVLVGVEFVVEQREDFEPDVFSPLGRMIFTNAISYFIHRYEFDGLDINWVFQQSDDDNLLTSNNDKYADFKSLVKDISKIFRSRGLLFTATISGNPNIAEEGEDLSLMAECLDWVNLMAYDYQVQQSHDPSGFTLRLGDQSGVLDSTEVVYQYVGKWLDKGFDSQDIVLGFRLFGRSYTLEHEIYVPDLLTQIRSMGLAGEDTKTEGILSYSEICERTLNRNWSVWPKAKKEMSLAAYKGDQWISFEDAERLRHRAKIIKNLNLLGAAAYSIDADDFRNSCGCEKYPLLKGINRALGLYKSRKNCKVTRRVINESKNSTNTKYISSAKIH